MPGLASTTTARHGRDLEVAKQMAALRVQPTNRVRFAFWGAEGARPARAEHYLANLPKAELKNLMLNLNFDMVGPELRPLRLRRRRLGDGDEGRAGRGTSSVSSSTTSPRRLPTAPTAFDGRSDYGPFIDRGIPGWRSLHWSRGIKSAAEAAVYGGTVRSTPVLPRGVRHLSDQRQLDGARPDGGRDRRCDPQFAMTTSSTSGTGKSSSSSQQSVGDFKGSLLRK